MSLFCSVCPLVRGRSPIPPSGPSPCKVLFLAEAPSRNEDAQGIPLADKGQSGREFNEGYLPICSLFRDDVAVTNAVICSQPNYRNPTPEEALVCATKHLTATLERVNPQIIVTMGAVSASLFPGISLVLHHGIPQPASFGSWSGIVFPTFHPAAGLRSTAYMIPLRRDFATLKTILKLLDEGLSPFEQDPHPSPDYQILRTVHDLSDYLRILPAITQRNSDLCRHYEFGTDTEFSSPTNPLCLTFSHTPGTARLIYADNKPVLKAYGSYLRCFRPLLSFHNFLADASPYTAMSLPTDPRRISDTMIRAYNLGIGGGGDDEDSGAARGSLGLKVLAYRHLHMHMSSFSDIVTPYVFPLVYDYLQSAISLVSAGETEKDQGSRGPVCECGHPQESHKERGKTRNRTGYCLADCSEAGVLVVCKCERFKKPAARKPDKEAGLLTRKLRTLSDQVLGAGLTGEYAPKGKKIDPWGRVADWHEWEKDLLLSFLGPMPVKSPTLIPENELVRYAGMDADATLRLSRYLNTYQI